MSPTLRSRPRATHAIPSDVGDAEHRPRERRPQRRPPAHRGDRGPVALACFGPPLPQRRADARDPHLLGGPGRGADEEEVPRQALVDGHRLLGGPLDARPPHRRQHGRRAGEQQQRQRRVDRAEQHAVTTSRRTSARFAEQRLEQVVEHERGVAQHGQAVEVLGALLVLDRGDRRLQPGDVGLHGDGDAIAEAPRQPLVDHADVPRRRHRHGRARWPPTAPCSAIPRSRRRSSASATAPAGRRAASSAPSWPATPRAAAARRGSRAGTCATAPASPTAALGAGAQSRRSWTTSSPCSSTSTNREAWSSNIVR